MKKKRIRRAEGWDDDAEGWDGDAEGWDGQFVLLYCYINQEKTSLRK